MKCLKPITVNGQEFNCGRCINCRINKSSEWTLRLLYELSTWDSASFVTLTYNEEHLPVDSALKPEHVREFHKALRYRLFKEDRKFRYYTVGEYGEKRKRPHYHSILFGLNPLSEHDRGLIMSSWPRCDDFIWQRKKKDNAIGEVTRESIQYVAGYVQKKLNGDLAIENYGDKQRPFMRCSQGLGLDFAMEHKFRIKSNPYLYLNGKKIAIPRYFRDKLEIDQKELIGGGLNKKKIDAETKYLYDLFIQDMKKKGTFKPENPDFMMIRFKQWYDNHMYSLSKRVELDFKQHLKMNAKEF